MFICSVPGFAVSFIDDWSNREWPSSGSAGADKISDRVKSFFKSMKSINDDRRNHFGKVYMSSLRATILEFCSQCSKANSNQQSGVSSFDRMFAPPQSDASSEMFSFDLRKEIALRELICAVADLDEMFPPNFMKSHFNAM